MERAPRRAWLILGLGLLAYVVAVFQRTSLGVAEVEAQRRFGTTAAVLSIFSVVQIAAYAGFQIPVGALLDRVGSRPLIAAGALIMAAGQLLLATVHAIGLAIAARALVGLGDALTFICVLRLIFMWFPAGQAPPLMALTGIVGNLGQFAAAYPLVALLASRGWSTSFEIAALGSFAVALASAAGIRSAPALGEDPGPKPRLLLRSGPLHAWREPGTRLGLWTHFVTQFSGMVFGLLWGYPFLVVGEGRSPEQAGLLLTLMVVFTMIGTYVVGQTIARWPLRRSAPVLAIVGATIVIWTVVLLWPGRAPLGLLVVLVIVLATNAPGSMTGFDYARTENEAERIGSAIGIVNVGGYSASLVTIALIGVVLSAQSSGGPHSYTLGDYKLAFCVQYIFWAIGLVAFLRCRRTLRAARGIELDPLHRAVAKRLRERSGAPPPAP
jgi:MFS family permease